MTRAISNISNFIFEENSIRAEVVGETPWFVAKDIALALGIEWRGSATLTRIKAAWKGVRKFRTPGGNQELTVINEPAVSKFVFRSNKEEADRFTDWLAGEVLPTIRKTGAYEADKPIHVEAHTRRTSTKIDDALRLKQNIDRLESITDRITPSQPNFCAMVIDGEPVFVDINDYAIESGDRAVVVTHDGRMIIEHVDPHDKGYKVFGARAALGPRFLAPSGGIARNGVLVVGKVMEQNVPAIRQKQIEAVTAALRRDVITMLEAAPYSDKQIASTLRCAPSVVKQIRVAHSKRIR